MSESLQLPYHSMTESGKRLLSDPYAALGNFGMPSRAVEQLREYVRAIEAEAYRQGMSGLAGAWKRKAKTYRLILRENRRDRQEWQSALRLAGVGRMLDLGSDHTRLTITVPSKRLVDKMLAEARALPPDPERLAVALHRHWHTDDAWRNVPKEEDMAAHLRNAEGIIAAWPSPCKHEFTMLSNPPTCAKCGEKAGL